MAKYTVNTGGRPDAAAALTPPIPVTPVSTFWGWANVTGSPGERAVLSPRPGVHSVSPEPLTQPSFCAPDYILPSLYQTVPDIGWRHTPVRPLEIMPVPATNLYNMAGVAMRARRAGGTHQVAQPGVVQSWPDLAGRAASRFWTAVTGSALPPRGAGNG